MQPLIPVLRDDLRELAAILIPQRLRLIPTGPNKKPLWHLLPKVPEVQADGTIVLKPSWKALVEQGPTTMEQVEYWVDCGATGLAVACGEWSDGLYAFDIDDPRFLAKWVRDNPEVAEILESVPLQQTGGGGYQFLVKVEGKTPKNTKYAYVPDEEEESGRAIALESRGQGGYTMLPFSVHPNGTYYRQLSGDWADIPVISREQLAILESTARATCEAPKTRQQIAREKRKEQKRKSAEVQNRKRRAAAGLRKRRGGGGSGSGENVIELVNSTISITDALERCGYTHDSATDRYIRPGGSNPSVVYDAVTDRSFHHSTNDEANDGYAKTAFNLICIHEYGDDVREAVKAMAEELSIDHGSNRQQPQPSQPRQPVVASVPDVPDVPAWMANAPDPVEPPKHFPQASKARQTNEVSYVGEVGEVGGNYYDSPPPMPPDWFDEPPPSAENERLTEYPILPTLPRSKVTIIRMKRGQHVSDVFNFAEIDEDRFLVQAITGGGKTTAGVKQYQAAHIQFDWFSPTQDLAKQIAEKHGLSLVMEDHDPDFSKAISSTYNGSEKIARNAQKNDHPYRERRAVVDEVHKWLSERFRQDTIRKLGHHLAEREVPVCAVSATMPPFVPFFIGAPIYKIVSEEPRITNVFFAYGEDEITVINELLKKNELVVFHLNNKNRLKAIQEELKKHNVNMCLFTAETKEEAHHQMMILKNELPKSRVLGCTSLINDGYSFYDDRTHVYVVSPASKLAPDDVVQFSARIRNFDKSRGVVIYRSEPKAAAEALKEVVKGFDYDLTLARAYKRYRMMAEKINEIGELEKIIDPDMSEVNSLAFKIAKKQGGLSGIRINADGKAQIDEIAIHQEVRDQWRAVCNANWDFMTKGLAEHHLIVRNLNNPHVFTEEKEQTVKERKKRISKIAKAFKDENVEKVLGYVQTIENISEAEMLEMNWNGMTKDAEQYKAASLIVDFCNLGVTFENAKELILKQEKLTDGAIKHTKTQIDFARLRHGLAREEQDEKYAQITNFYRAFLISVQVGDVLSTEDIERLVKQAVAQSGSVLASRAYESNSKTVKALLKSKRKRTALLKNAFEVVRRRAKEGESGYDPENRVWVYEVIGLHPVKIELDLPAIKPASEAPEVAEVVEVAQEPDREELVYQLNLFDDQIRRAVEWEGPAHTLKYLMEQRRLFISNEQHEFARLDQVERWIVKVANMIDDFFWTNEIYEVLAEIEQ